MKHFVTPQKNDDTSDLNGDYAILRSSVDLAGWNAEGYTWESDTTYITTAADQGSVYPGDANKNKYRVKRDKTNLTKVRIMKGTVKRAEIYVWVVWGEVTPTKGIGIWEAGTDPRYRTRKESPFFKYWIFKFVIKPTEIFDYPNIERPKLYMANETDPPGGSKLYVPDNSAGTGDDAAWKWDVSRKMKITIRNPSHILKADIEAAHGAWTVVNYPIPTSPNQDDYTPLNFPTEPAEGNDDTPAGAGIDEADDPYQAETPSVPGHVLDHAKGELTSLDSPLFQVSTSWGGAGKIFNWEVNFKEFARVELWDGQRTKVATGTHTWFRISDYCDWHFYFKSQWATSNWIDNSSATDAGHPNP